MVAVVVAREVALRVEVAELVERSGQWSGQLVLRGAPLLAPTRTELGDRDALSELGLDYDDLRALNDPLGSELQNRRGCLWSPQREHY